MDVSLLRAFAVAADAADGAAAFVFDNAAAVRTGAFTEYDFFVLHFSAVGFDVGLNGLGHSVGTGQDFVFTETGR